MLKASLEAMQFVCLGIAGIFLYWVWLKLRELAGFKMRDRFEKVEQDIQNSTVRNNDTSLEDLVDRENQRARKRNS